MPTFDVTKFQHSRKVQPQLYDNQEENTKVKPFSLYSYA